MEKFPFIFSNERKYRIRRHLWFWVTWWIFTGILYSFLSLAPGINYLERLGESMIESLLFLSAHIFLSYSLIYYVIPRYLLKGRYIQTIFLTAFSFLIAAAIGAVLSIFVVEKLRIAMFSGYVCPIFANFFSKFFLSLMAGLRGGITIGGIAAAIKLTKYWYIKEQRNMQLQKENAAAQLKLLKAQIHPHFLFNTLNNIYSHTQYNSPKASSMVMGLSDMLRYILYEASQSKVLLNKELQMISDYIALEKERYGNSLELHITISGETDGLIIAPLLLLPFVENSFKHGCSKMLDQPWVSLYIQVEERTLKMKLVNAKLPVKIDTKENAGGIGLVNAQKRLELLYPGKHRLVVTDEEDVFIVDLQISLERTEMKSVPEKMEMEYHE